MSRLRTAPPGCWSRRSRPPSSGRTSCCGWRNAGFFRSTRGISCDHCSRPGGRPGADPDELDCRHAARSTPAGGYPAARGGFLDAETVWPMLLLQEVGLPAESLDLTSLLKWTLDAVATGRFRSSSPTFREGAIEWLVEKVGEVAGVILLRERAGATSGGAAGNRRGRCFPSACRGQAGAGRGEAGARLPGGEDA